jgi:streptogramin lyase
MRLSRWFRPPFFRAARPFPRQVPRRQTSRLRVETLEDRCAPAISITDFSVPTPNSGPDWIIKGPDGNLWFNEVNVSTTDSQGQSHGRIARMAPDGHVDAFSTPLAQAGGLVAGTDGNIWFTDTSGGDQPTTSEIAVMSTAGVVLDQFALPTGTAPTLTVGPDGNIWFADYWHPKVGRVSIDTTLSHDQRVQEFDIPFSFGAANITTGPDGNLWYTSAVRDSYGGVIGRITPQGDTLPSFSFGVPLLRGLATENAFLWAGDIDNDAILQINEQGQVVGRYVTPTQGSAPYSLALGPDNNIWFTEIAVSQIGRVTDQGAITEFPTQTPHSGVTIISPGPGNTLWFTEQTVNKIGRLAIGQPPVPSVVTRNSAGTVTTTFNEGDQVYFDASGCTDPNGVPLIHYEWDLDGDGVFESVGSQVSHVFTENGVYHVTLRVTDTLDFSSTLTVDVTVNEVQPTVTLPPDRTVTEDSRILPITVSAGSTDPSPTDLQSGVTYTWTVTKNGQPYASDSQTGNPYSFTPDGSGTYVVSLAYTDRDGSATASETINVVFLPIPANVQLTPPESTVQFVSGPGNFIPVGSTLYFFADDGVHGQQLWRTNGQPGDAIPVESEGQSVLTTISNPEPVGSTLYFFADDGVHGQQLWRTNGQPDDAVPVETGGMSVLTTIRNPEMALVGHWLYFFTDNGDFTYTLWRNDSLATPTGDISPSEAVQTFRGPIDDWGPYQLTVADSDLYFGGYSRDNTDKGWAVWKIPGANAPSLPGPATPISPDGGFAVGPWVIQVVGSNLYFAGGSTPDDMVLWVSNGTTVQPVRTAAGGYVSGDGDPQSPFWRTVVDQDLYLIEDGFLWRVSGMQGTQIAQVGQPPTSHVESDDYPMTVAGNALYFATAAAGSSGYSVWKYDLGGDSAPQIVHQATTPNDYTFIQLVSAGSDVYFIDLIPGTIVKHLWKIDGTSGNAVPIQGFGFPGEDPNAIPFALTAIGSTVCSTLYFEGPDGRLWQKVGTADTPSPTGLYLDNPLDLSLLQDSGGRPGIPALSPFAVMGRTLYFRRDNELYRLDNPVAPTLSVTDTGGTYNGSAFPATATVAGVLSGVDDTPSASLEGIPLTLTYYAGATAAGSPLAGAPSAAGTYTVVATYPGTIDYTSATAQATFTIAQATLTVTADAQIVQQGTAIPSLTASCSGFVGSQTLATSDVTGSPSLSTPANASSPEGAYAITTAQGTLASANYTFRFVNSVLYVTSAADQLTSAQSAAVNSTSAPVTASATGSGSNPPALTATASGYDGTLTVAQFTANPSTGFTASGDYFDVNVAPQQGASLDSAAVTVQLQNLTANAPLLWWNGSSWAEVTDPSGQAVLADAAGNASVTFTNTTSPTVAQLNGTYFLAGKVLPRFQVSGGQQITFGTATLTVSGTLGAGSLIPSDETITATLGGQSQTATVSATGSFTLTFNTATLPASSTPCTVDYHYAGDSRLLPDSTSSTFTIRPAATTTALTTSLSTALPGQQVTFTATVSRLATGAGTPTGSVDFFDTTTQTDLGSIPLALVNGVETATLTTTALALGSHSIRAAYNGDGNFLSSYDSKSVSIIPPPASLSGMVFEDFNDDGQVDFGERAIAGVTINLTGTDDLGNSVNQSQPTEADGSYRFDNLRPGNYYLTETQPAGYLQGIDSIGTAGGSLAATDRFFVQLSAGIDAINYNYGERPQAGGVVQPGQTASIGFWHNNKGQALIRALNGGSSSTQLADWLATTLLHMYGSQAGSHSLIHANGSYFSNSEVATFYQSLFNQSGPKLDAQVLATALSVYVTNATLDPTLAASSYGFTVTGDGAGTATANVGSNGDSFGVANNTTLTLMDLLQATDAQTVNGVLYNGNTPLRNHANNVYSALNQAGDIS